MHPTARAAVALAILLAPGVQAQPGPVAVRWLLVPETAPASGEAMAARIAIDGLPPGLTVQVRAWLSGPGLAGAQTWNGTAWARADRYQLAWSGATEGWLVVRAAEAGPGPWALQVRARDPAGRVLAEASVDLAAPSDQSRQGVSSAPLVGAWIEDRLVALSPTHSFATAERPWDIPGRFGIRAAPGATLRMVHEDGSRGPTLAPQAPGDLRFAAVLPDPAGADEAEFVRLTNAGGTVADLAGWHVDGPGWRAVLAGGELAPGGALALARDAEAYRALTGRDDLAEDVRWQGGLQLPNASGSLGLAHWGEERDAVAWGTDPAPPAPGMVLLRDDGGDWTAPAWSAAWTPRAPQEAAAEVAAFTTAEALGTLAAALDRAEREVLVATYTFTHPGLAGALAAALTRGVRVGVLVEAAPVGGVPAEEEDLLGALAAAGAEVWRIGGSGRDRYGTMHAKYAVIDERTLLLGSENWTPSGFPEHGRGNVGWGALFHAESLAQYYAGLWREDVDPGRGDVRPWPPGPVLALAAPSTPGGLPELAPSQVTALSVPENAGPAFLSLLARAKRSIDLEALQLPPAWADGPNAVLAALRDAAARGVKVRIIVDGSEANAGTVAAVEAWARDEGLSIAARAMPDRRVHNKAAVVDGAAAWMGSMNFGEASMTRNRETAVLVEGAPVATWAAAFEADWQAAGPVPEPTRAEPHLVAAPLALAVLAAVWRGRRRR